MITRSFSFFLIVLLYCMLPNVCLGLPQEEIPPGQGNLPIGLTPEEEGLTHLIGIYRDVTPPPDGPVRSAAEWDESIGVFTLWSNAELIDELQKDNDVYIITTNTSWWLSWLSSHGIPSTNFHFLIAPTNSLYTRDYGPWFIWDGHGDFGLVDNIYNRPRPDDDVIPEKISQAYRIPYFGMDLVHTGGNYYTDGFGNAFSTQLVFKENPGKTKEQVKQIMHEYLGIDCYHNPDISYSIEHFDTYGKILAPDRMIWGLFPENTTPWIYNEAALKYWQTRQSPYGWPFKILRMPLWDAGGSWTAYINALQTNNKIITGKYWTAHDQEAKAIYEAIAPGYDVINVDAGGTNWGDSIHCRTRNFHKGDTIRIYPAPHWESTDDDVNPYEIRAEIIPDNSTSLKGDPLIYWTTTGGPPFSQEIMSPTGNPDEYGGAIQAQPHGTLVSYYIHAEDHAGNEKDCPLVAPDGMFVIQVEDDILAPELDHDAIHGLALSDWPCTVTCTAIDNTGIPSVSLEYEINGMPQGSVTLVKQEGTFVFSGEMTGSVSLGDLISYRITAVDGASPANAASNPSMGWNYFTIDPRNKVLVVELDSSPDSGSVLVDVCDDLGLNVQYSQSWPADPSNYDVLMICLGMDPMNTALSWSEANQLKSYLNGGGSAYMEGGDCWAQDSSKNVYNSYFGIDSASSGKLISSAIVGVPGEITQGMNFTYHGEKNSSDHLTPSASADVCFTSGGYNKAVLYSTGTYNTVAQSFQSADLVEKSTPSHIKYLAACYLNHLGMDIGLVVHTDTVQGRMYTFELKGDAYADYMLLYALSPGYYPFGSAGILQIDPGTIKPLLTGILPVGGVLNFDVSIPNDPSLSGLEFYFQAYMKDMGSGTYYLTNRDRMVIDID